MMYGMSCLHWGRCLAENIGTSKEEKNINICDRCREEGEHLNRGECVCNE